MQIQPNKQNMNVLYLMMYFLASIAYILQIPTLTTSEYLNVIPDYQYKCHMRICDDSIYYKHYNRTMYYKQSQRDPRGVFTLVLFTYAQLGYSRHYMRCQHLLNSVTNDQCRIPNDIPLIRTLFQMYTFILLFQCHPIHEGHSRCIPGRTVRVDRGCLVFPRADVHPPYVYHGAECARSTVGALSCRGYSYPAHGMEDPGIPPSDKYHDLIYDWYLEILSCSYQYYRPDAIPTMLRRNVVGIFQNWPSHAGCTSPAAGRMECRVPVASAANGNMTHDYGVRQANEFTRCHDCAPSRPLGARTLLGSTGFITQLYELYYEKNYGIQPVPIDICYGLYVNVILHSPCSEVVFRIDNDLTRLCRQFRYCECSPTVNIWEKSVSIAFILTAIYNTYYLQFVNLSNKQCIHCWFLLATSYDDEMCTVRWEVHWIIAPTYYHRLDTYHDDNDIYFLTDSLKAIGSDSYFLWVRCSSVPQWVPITAYVTIWEDSNICLISYRIILAVVHDTPPMSTQRSLYNGPGPRTQSHRKSNPNPNIYTTNHDDTNYLDKNGCILGTKLPLVVFCIYMMSIGDPYFGNLLQSYMKGLVCAKHYCNKLKICDDFVIWIYLNPLVQENKLRYSGCQGMDRYLLCVGVNLRRYFVNDMHFYVMKHPQSNYERAKNHML